MEVEEENPLIPVSMSNKVSVTRTKNDLLARPSRTRESLSDKASRVSKEANRKRENAMNALRKMASEEAVAKQASENPLKRAPVKAEIKTVKKLKTMTPKLASPSLVSVKGNNKVLRCERCNTFVKKGASHTQTECDARIAKKAAGPSRSSVSRKSKKFRMTPKRDAYIKQMIYNGSVALEVFKNMKRLEKWVLKKEKSLSKSSKALFASLIESFRKQPKYFDRALRKAGLK